MFDLYFIVIKFVEDIFYFGNFLMLFYLLVNFEYYFIKRFSISGFDD